MTMGKIPESTIDQILERLDIVEIVSEYVHLRKAGRSFKACCPFHNEKTPSFVVSPDKQIFHCFGCGAGGNAIGFLMKHENLTFPEAAARLADKAGVELPRNDNGNPEEVSLTKRIYEVNNTAALFFQNHLHGEKGKKALEYLKTRGLKADTLSAFRIGYAPPEWESLRKYFAARNVSMDLLRTAGLTVQSNKGKEDYDRFRDRIIFPIFNEKGDIAGFGGRVMDDSTPKYINSPETPVYNKSGVLYGLSLSKRSIRDKGYVLITEGYMDVVIPYQHGVTNVVAASGTAFTPRQARILRKYTDTAVIIFDADQAGESASLRGLDILLENDTRVRIATLDTGEDPDSFVRKYGAEKFGESVDNAKDIFDYKLGLLIRKYKGTSAKDKASIVSDILPTIAKVSNAVIKATYLRNLAKKIDVDERVLKDELDKVSADRSYKFDAEIKVAAQTGSECSNSELHLLGLIISDKKAYEKIRTGIEGDMFRDANMRKAVSAVEECYKSADTINPGQLLNRLEGDEEVKKAVIQALMKAEITEDKDKAVSDCITYIRRVKRENELKFLSSQLKAAQAACDDSEMRKLLLRINDIHKMKVA